VGVEQLETKISTAEVQSSSSAPASSNNTERRTVMTPEQLKQWQKHCQSLMENPPRSAGT